jgi:hypothetical protein
MAPLNGVISTLSSAAAWIEHRNGGRYRDQGIALTAGTL